MKTGDDEYNAKLDEYLKVNGPVNASCMAVAAAWYKVMTDNFAREMAEKGLLDEAQTQK